MSARLVHSVPTTKERTAWFISAGCAVLCAVCHHSDGGDLSRGIDAHSSDPIRCDRCCETRSVVIVDCLSTLEYHGGARIF